LPGGKIKLGESLDDGLKREILEEVGLMVRILPITYVQYVNS
jgi:ADP-ribose pyrophosphatase YjhB (NUDIX family)